MAMVQRNQEHERGTSLHHHDKHAAHKDGHRPDDPHGVTAATSEMGARWFQTGVEHPVNVDLCENCGPVHGGSSPVPVSDFHNVPNRLRAANEPIAGGMLEMHEDQYAVRPPYGDDAYHCNECGTRLHD